MIANVRRGALFALAAISLALPASARADGPASVDPDSTARVTAGPAGPTAAAAAVAVKSLQPAAESAEAMQARAGLGRPRALMFVGLGMFIAGALIGNDAGTIIMISGAAIGLWGLYQYLQ